MRSEQYQQLLNKIGSRTTLVAVSKHHPVESMMHLYHLGHRDFGENYVQELIEKQLLMPADVRWHFIGHLQSNKIKYIAPFVYLVQSVDSFKLLLEINRQAKKIDKVIDCLLQVHIAQEETKFGLYEEEIDELIVGFKKAVEVSEVSNVRITGLMGMGSLSNSEETVRTEFKYLAMLYDKYSAQNGPHIQFEHLSMGMSADYELAISEGSNMVRVGSLLFGHRPKI
ncbi:MAG: YggS family pyridoxal phosphate-dependent enzyme [Flavitalea sp.]